MPRAKRMQVQEKVYDRRSTDLPINSVVVPVIVQDADGDYIEVLRSIRNDPLADMLSRRVIDQALYLAGRKWQALAERSTIGSIKAMDPGKEAVDGGRMPEPLTDAQVSAFRELGEAHRRLGEWGSALMRDLLESHMTVGQMASKYGLRTARETDFMSRRVRECLEDLGKLWGFVG